MYLLIGGDSGLGAATCRHLRDRGSAVKATTRRPAMVSPDRPFFDISRSLDDWQAEEAVDSACIFVAVARLRDCEADPAGTAFINVTQTLQLIDKLISHGIYVLYLSSNQVFDGNTPNVPADSATCPVSEYGRQKVAVETAIRDRMAKGAKIGILRLSKIFAPTNELLHNWTNALLRGESIQAFADMNAAPVPIELASAAIAALLNDKLSGVFQLSGPRDVTYVEIAHHIAKEYGARSGLIEPITAFSEGMPEGSTARYTSLDSTYLRERFGIVVPDVSELVSAFIASAKSKNAGQNVPGLKVLELDDLAEVADGIYYSRYSLPLVDAKVIEFLKGAALKSPLRRARFCAHLSPDSEQHDMLIASHRDTYVAPHRHLNKSETLVVLEGSAEMILFNENGTVEKTLKMGPPTSGRPFFYRMPPRQFHSLAIESDLLVFLENTTGPFTLHDREFASWAPDFGDLENGKAYIASILRETNANRGIP